MTKKLYVPDRIAAQRAKAINPTPKAISKASKSNGRQLERDETTTTTYSYKVRSGKGVAVDDFLTLCPTR